MSGEMKARVAKAIGDYYDGYISPEDTPNSWARAMAAAELAIEAMREPTKEMLESGAGEVWLFDPDVDGPNAKAGDVWRAMIDEAKN